MSKKRRIQAVVGPNLVFFAIRALFPGETVAEGYARMDNPFVDYASETHFDILLGSYRRRYIAFRGWQTVFGVEQRWMLSGKLQYSFAVWGLRVRQKDIQRYDEALQPDGRCGILVVTGSVPVFSSGFSIKSFPGPRVSGPSRP